MGSFSAADTELLLRKNWFVPSVARRWRAFVRDAGRLDMANLTDVLGDVYDARPAIFLEQPLDYPFFRGSVVTYRALAGFVNRIGHVLRRLGVQRGERVGLVTANRVELAFAEFAAIKIGAVPVPINSMLRADEIRYLMENSGARVLVTDRAVFESSIKDRSRIPSVETWIMVTSQPVPGGFEALGPLMTDAPEELAGERLAPDDVVIIFYTAGTTGLPRGAMLTNAGLMFVVRRAARLAALLPMERYNLSLLVMPLAHTSGHQALLLLLAQATPTYFMGRFDPVAVLDAIERYRITVFSGIPAMYRMLLEAGAAERDVSSIRIWGGGADAFSDDLIRTFRDLVAARRRGLRRRPLFVRGYGLAETAGQVSMALPGALGDACLGWVLPGLRYRLIDSEGRDVAPGKVGELVVKGPTVMKGYWASPEMTAGSFTPDGFFRTGDLAWRGRWRLLYMAAREKEVIKAGGYSVFPAEVEKKLEEHPAVGQAAMVGLPDPVKGERPVAAVVLHPGATVRPEEIREWARERIAPYKCPREVFIVESIPLGFGFKPKRSEVREMLLDRLHQGSTAVGGGA